MIALTENTSVAEIEIALRSGGLEIEPLTRFQNDECADVLVSALIHASNGVLMTFYTLYLDDLKSTYELLAAHIHEALHSDNEEARYEKQSF